MTLSVAGWCTSSRIVDALELPPRQHTQHAIIDIKETKTIEPIVVPIIMSLDAYVKRGLRGLFVGLYVGEVFCTVIIVSAVASVNPKDRNELLMDPLATPLLRFVLIKSKLPLGTLILYTTLAAVASKWRLVVLNVDILVTDT